MPQGHPELLTNYLLQRRIWKRLLRYAPSDSSAYRRGYACGVLGRKPRSHNHLRRFAAKVGEKSGICPIGLALGWYVTPLRGAYRRE